MQPKTVVDDGSEDLFRSRLLAMIDPRHELVPLARTSQYDVSDEKPRDTVGAPPKNHAKILRPGLFPQPVKRHMRG